MLGVHVSKISKVVETIPRRRKPTKENPAKKRVRKTMVQAIRDDSNRLMLTAVQIYTHGPRNFKANQMDYEAIKGLTEELNISVHSTYATGGSHKGIWRVTEETKKQTGSRNNIRHFSDQLLACSRMGASGFVVHLPRKSAAAVAETLKVDLMQEVIKKHGVPIMLEMIPVKDQAEGESFLTPDQINELIEEMEFMDDNLWGICVDTAHLWGGGVDVSTAEAMQGWLDAIDDRSMIKMFHLNGSEKKTWNSGRDVHIIAFSEEDDMFRPFKEEPKKSGVYPIVKFCMENKLPVICEINRGSEKDARASLQIINGLVE